MSYLQSNALGLLLPKDQTQAQTLGGAGLSTMYGPQMMLPDSGGALGTVLGDYAKKMESYGIGKMGQGQAQNQYGNGLSTQQAAEDNPYGYGEQQYDPGAHYTSLYQTGKIIG